jgi:hypothetical protein
MTQCFKDLECDTQVLNQNTKPISECEIRSQNLYDCDSDFIEVPILTCEGLWRIFQREAEEIVAPGGVLIADPKERNRAINAGYARLWLHDSRFQWAGLAAFASKQVGCGLLHAADSIDRIQAERDALQDIRDSRRKSGLFTPEKMPEQAQLMRDHEQADAVDGIPGWLPNSKVRRSFEHVYEMMALGNTTLFLDIYPLHMFYAKRGLAELKTCLKKRAGIFGHPEFPVLWPIGEKALKFGQNHEEILLGFEAIDQGQISEGVIHLAWHEQKNILQSSMYGDIRLVLSLRSNQYSYATNFPSGLGQSIELTLASQCQRLEDGRTVGFSDDRLANLADLEQRMPFVLKAAGQFDKMLNDSNRSNLEQAVRDIAAGGGVE